MPIIDPFDSRTTNTGIIDPFDAPKSAQLKIKDPFDTKVKPSFFKSALKAPIAGVGDAIEMYSRALRTTDPEGGWDVVRNVATKGVDLGKSIAEKFPTESEDFGLVKRGVVGGIRSSVPSVAAGVPGAIIGMLGGIPGMVGGYAGSGAIITGAAEYDHFIEEAEKAGIPKEISRSNAIKSAFVEGGIEGIANLIDASMLKLGKPITAPIRHFITNMLKVGGVESGTEALQAGLESKLRRDVGIPALPPLEAAKEAVIPALTMGGIVGASGTYANKMLSRTPRTIIDPFDNQVKPPQIQQTEKQEVVLPPGEKPLIQPLPKPENVEIVKQQPKGFTPIEAAPVVSKEAWQMTKNEYKDLSVSRRYEPHERLGMTQAINEVKKEAELEHKNNVQQAYSEGKPIPPEVLKDYPELQKQTHTMPSGEVMLGAEHTTEIPSAAKPIQDELLHNNEPVTKVEAKQIIGQSQQDYSPKAIKQHKAYLFEQIDEAIKDAKDYEVEPVSISTYESISQKEAETTNKLKAAGASVGFVTIEVPGDGKFRIINSKQALSKFKNDVVAKFPTTKFSNVQKIEKAPMGVVADKAKGIEQIMEGTYKNQPIHGNGNMLLFTPLKIKPKSYRTDPNGDRVSMPPRIDELIDKKTPHYNVDDIVFFVQKADEVEATSDIPLPYLKEDMAIAELYAGDKHTFISQDYYNYIKAHFPDATFKIADIDKAVQIYSNKKLVGLVMPLELPSHAPTKAKGEIVKEPSGTADAGGYVPTKEQTSYTGAERQAQELPEVVELYNEISKGKYPSVERYMKDKLGYFSPRKDKIGLRQDLPIGERIQLAPHIEGFKDLLTTVPDLSIRKGDIIIERDTIAVSPRVFKTISQEFENYMRKESGLTDEEIAFRKDFNKKTRMYELRAYKRDKTLALKILSHEVFHYIDALPDQAKRGNVLGHIATLKKYLKHMLDTFPTSAEADINETKIELRKQSLKEAKGQPEFWKAANQRYKELLAQELTTREVTTKQEVIAELKALTQKVKPFDDTANPKFKAYRYSPKELYADAGGALLWNPKLLQETAPKFYKSFFAYLERKPEVKQTYDAIQNKLGMIPGLRRDVVIQGRIERMKEGYGRGRKARKEMEERRKTSAETIVDTILNQAVDDEHANLKRIRTLEKGSESDREIGRKARLSIEELKMIDSKIENYVNQFTKEVDAEMLKNNITLDDMGVLAQAARVIEERSKLDIFNPGGETLETSREMLSHLQQSWGREKFNKVAELFAKFQQLRQRFVMPALEEGKRYDPELIEYAKNNLFYTRFSVSKYLTERFGGQITGTIYKQYGTLSEIESPIEATIIQDIMLIRAAKVNELKLDMIEVLKRTNELTPAEIDKSTKKWEPKPPPDRNNYDVFTVMRDGKPEHYYVDKQIVESYQFEPYRAKQISAIVHMISEPFRRLFVTRNPRWMFKNPIRDIKSTIKQVPEIKLRNIPEFMLDYGRGVKESFSDVFLGKRSEDISNLMEKSGLITGRYYDQDNFETKIEELQAQFSLEHHPKKVEGAWNRLKRVYQIIDRQFDKAGRVSDISTKVAGYKYLKKHSVKSEREIMHDVRTLVGTPNSRRQGRLHWLSNNIFMFSNIGKEGLRSSWESYRTKPTAYLWKTTALNVLPLLTLLGAGAAGVEWVKKILEELSQYDLESKTIIPTPYTVNNKPVAIAIPEDYQGMVVRKLVFNIMNKDVGGSLKALWDAKPYQWHPMIKIGNALFQYYMLGNNPKDTFRNRDIIPRDKFEVGGLTASKSLLKHTWNELGGSLFYRFPYDDVKEDFKSIETLKKTFPMNALGDFLVISNEGIKQSSYKIQDRLNQAYEKRRFDVKQEIKKNINSSETRKTDKDILKELYIPLARKKLFDYKTTSPTEFINKYRRLESKKEDNPYLDSLENAHRNEVKEALLDEYSQKMSRKELLQLLLTALKEKIITDEFTKNYLIKRKAASPNR